MSRKPELPPTLFHYCCAAAFEGIVASDELWLSDSEHTNDRSENSWAVERIEEFSRGYLPGDELPRLIGAFRTARLPPHISCFSAREDELSQWRGYADDGAGFSIGFDVPRFGELGDLLAAGTMSSIPVMETVVFDYPTRLVQVLYAEEQQRELIARVFRAYKVDREGNPDVALARLQMRLHGASLAIKHPSFSDEGEWRIVGEQTVTVKSDGAIELSYAGEERRSGPGRGRKVLLMNDRGIGHPVVSVRLGPRNSRTPEEIVEFLETHGLYDVRVMLSSSPYRRPPE